MWISGVVEGRTPYSALRNCKAVASSAAGLLVLDSVICMSFALD